MNMRKEVVSGAFVEEDKGILLVKKEDVWILPGGKKKERENYEECLYREVEEELPNLKIINPIPVEKTFTGITPHSRTPVEVLVFAANVEGSIETAREIYEAKWFTLPINAIIGEVTSQVIGRLYCNGALKGG